jgi:tRNA U34 5-carboxymethylaminomethyl modifying enzyme MnmG/GidA
MNELKPEDVMKALECCTRGRKHKDDRPCLECPYNFCNIVGGTDERQVSGTCQGWMMKDALALLREKDAEIERLKAIPEQLHKEMSDRMTEEVKTATKYAKKIARAEAITEFENRLIKYYDALKSGLVAYHIKEVAKELKEDLNAT